MEAPIILESLSTFEIIEFLFLTRDAAATDLTTFMSVLFAFLVAAYIAGDKLTRFQLGTILFVYSLFMVITLQSLYIQLEQTFQAAYALSLDTPDNVVFTNDIFVGLLGLCWVLSIGFLIETRIKAKNQSAA
jgi:predicted permease